MSKTKKRRRDAASSLPKPDWSWKPPKEPGECQVQTCVPKEPKDVLVTLEFINSGARGFGGYCAAQLKILGINWPPSKGWKKAVASQRKCITKTAAEAFIGYGSGEMSKNALRHFNRTKKIRKDGVAPSVAMATYSAEFIASKDFLQTFEWRTLRYKALKKYGAKCGCCGASPATGATLNVDHIKPRARFPQLALDIDNLQVLCDACNHGKSNWDTTDWRTAADGHGSISA